MKFRNDVENAPKNTPILGLFLTVGKKLTKTVNSIRIDELNNIYLFREIGGGEYGWGRIEFINSLIGWQEMPEFLEICEATPKKVAGRTKNQWCELSQRDDCFDSMVPGDLRQLLAYTIF